MKIELNKQILMNWFKGKAKKILPEKIKRIIRGGDKPKHFTSTKMDKDIIKNLFRQPLFGLILKVRNLISHRLIPPKDYNKIKI